MGKINALPGFTGSYFHFGADTFVDTLTHTVWPRDGFKPVVGRMSDTLGHTSAAGNMRGFILH